MLVHHIKTFTNALSLMRKHLSEHDVKFLHAFYNRYSTKNDNEAAIIVEEEEIRWIQERFAERWLLIANTFDDYTFYPGGVNAPWVDMSKYLSTRLEKPYFLILIPPLANQYELKNFYRLNQLTDTRYLYQSDDHRWHRTTDLFEELQKSAVALTIIDKPKGVKSRALTLNELARIRAKRDVFKGKDDKSYANFWAYMTQEIIPIWQPEGFCPSHLLPLLLEIIQNYLEIKTSNGDLSLFNKQFREFAEYLADCTLAEINHLYAMPIEVNMKKRFLVEIFLDCMQSTEDLSESLLAVARWLCNFDPSLTCSASALTPIHENFKAGCFLDRAYLQKLIIELNVENIQQVNNCKNHLLASLLVSPATEIDSSIISKIREMYSLRWKDIKDKPSDYTRVQKEPINEAWTSLAKYLARAGFINLHYYSFLIPTLRHEIDPVTLEPLTKFPLTHYIVSTDGTKLIYLGNCLQHYKAKGTFYNCNYPEPMPLSSLERKRLQFAAPEFSEYLLQIDEMVEDPPISMKTILVLRDLVDGTLHPDGLSSSISPEELHLANRAYERFLDFLTKISDEERNKLFRQRILYNASFVTFAEVMDRIQAYDEEKRECITVQAQLIAKLVIDYAPWINFNHKIELRAHVDKMRNCSVNKVCSEYSAIDDREIITRLLTILVSLMSHKFNSFRILPAAIEIWDQSNMATDSGIKIFTLLKDELERGHFARAHFTYALLIEKIIKPALINKTWKRYNDTNLWLQSIIDETLFKKEKNFAPEQIVIVLWQMVQKNSKSSLLIQTFLDQLVQTLVQSENSYKKWIRVNIKFNKLLNDESLTKSEQTEILETLRDSDKEPINAQLVIKTCMNFLVHRLAWLGASEISSKQWGFFGVDPGQFKVFYNNFKNEFEEQLAVSKNLSADGTSSISEIIFELQEMVRVDETSKKSAAQLKYLNEITHEIGSELSPKRSTYIALEQQVFILL